MSSRTVCRRFARARASAIVDFRRANSRRWSASVERWSVRFWSLAADELTADSESSRRESEATTVSRRSRSSESVRSVVVSSEVGFGSGFDVKVEYVWKRLSV